MSSLADREKVALLQIAREALVDAVKHGKKPPMDESALADAGSAAPAAGAFVTLRCKGQLRGCIGQIGTGLPLDVVVAHCAVAAATEDPRFRALRSEELGDAELEVSVLSAPQEIAPDAVTVGKHGLIVSRGIRRGLLLPQVAEEYRLTPQRFLEETCVKAGLPRDAWKDPATRIEAFTAEVFSEREMDRVPDGARSE
jgi:AmmeMemoRadiSam system protein A